MKKFLAGVIVIAEKTAVLLLTKMVVVPCNIVVVVRSNLKQIRIMQIVII